MARFEQERIDDFKDALQAFLEGMISRQKEVSGLQLQWRLCKFDEDGHSSSLPGKTINKCC